MKAMLFVRLTLLFVLGILVVLAIKRMILCVLNIIALFNRKDRCLPINQRHGIVYNKKNKKLEADQSLILPYE